MEFQLQQESGVTAAPGEWSYSSSRRVEFQWPQESGATSSGEEAPAAHGDPVVDETPAAEVDQSTEALVYTEEEENGPL